MSDQSTPVTRLPPAEGCLPALAPFLFIFLQSVLYGLGDPISKSAYEVLPRLFPADRPLRHCPCLSAAGVRPANLAGD